MGGGGGKSSLESMFPGFKDKIWHRIPSRYRKLVISKWNRDYESAIKHRYTVSEKLGIFHNRFLDKFTPPAAYQKPFVDYKRQISRGTLVEAPGYYIALPEDRNRLTNPSTPYTKEEYAERRKYQFFSLKHFLICTGSFLILDAYLQGRPVAWCLESPPPEPPKYPWWFRSCTHAHDIPSVRRGYEVYRKVCATCHSMKEVHFRHLIDEVYPEQRVKQIAATYDVQDGPNDEGEMFTRPGVLTDAFPNPYPNNNAARYSNGGALPPDMSCLAAATYEGPDYLMALLLGYRGTPVGLNLRSGLYYNVYFPGGTIAMPPPLQDDLIEYEDGTPATVSQMAKDVVQFLTWAAEPIHDRRKLMAMKSLWAVAIGGFFIRIYYRMFWTMIATRRVDFGHKITVI